MQKTDTRHNAPAAEADRPGPGGGGAVAPLAPIMLNAFRAPDGSEAAIIVNATDQQQNVRFQWQQEARTLQLAPWTMQQLVR